MDPNPDYDTSDEVEFFQLVAVGIVRHVPAVGLSFELVVMSREVGQSCDWWLASDGGVGSMMIVEMQPARQGDVALFG